MLLRRLLRRFGGVLLVASITIGGLLAAVALPTAIAASAASTAPRRAFDANVSNDPNTDSGEPMVAVNPTDANNVIVTYTQSATGSELYHQVVPGVQYVSPGTQCGFAVTKDGGRTWERRFIPINDPGTDPAHWACADPNVVFDRLGNAYISSGTYGAVANGDIRLITSVDGGSTWGDPVVVAYTVPESGTNISTAGDYVGLLTDQPWLAVDDSSHTVYVSWRQYRAASGGTSPFGDTRYVASSSDGGATFSLPVAVDSAAYPGGDAPMGVALGAIALAYVPSGQSSCSCVVLTYSTDGGKTFTQVPTPILGASAPHIAADPTRRGAYAVLVLTGGATKVQVWRTSDFGATWSGPVSLTSTTETTTKFKPWLAFGPKGTLGALWRTEYADGSYDVFAATARPGHPFSAPVRLNSAVSPAPQPYYVAGDDFSTVMLTDSTLYGAWGDWRSGHMDAWWGGLPLG
jgi:hypothetical protein